MSSGLAPRLRTVLGEVNVDLTKSGKNFDHPMKPLQQQNNPQIKKAKTFTVYQENDENAPPPPLKPSSRPPASDFWADKIAKLPTVKREPLQPLPISSSSQGFSIYEDEQDENHQLVSSSLHSTCFDEPENISTTSRTEEDEEDNEMDTGAAAVTTEAALEKQPEEPQLSPEMVRILNCDEYQGEILGHLYAAELNHSAKHNYMVKQPDITYGMRQILVDWLVEVGEEYKLQQETIYLAVNYIDRFLSHMSVQRAKLQLVGTACMFIAAKYEEIYPPDVGEFVYITDDTYSKKQVLRMELLVLKVLDFNLSVPTTLLYTNLFCRLSECDEETISLAQYLSELSQMDGERYLQRRPSILAASSVALARHNMGVTAWPENLATKVGIAVEDFRECVVELHDSFAKAKASPQQAIREKYKQDKFHKVACLDPLPIATHSED